MFVFHLGQGAALEHLHAFNDGEATCHFPPGDGVGKACGVVGGQLFFDSGGEGGEFVDVGDEVGFDLFVDGEEGVSVGGGHGWICGERGEVCEPSSLLVRGQIFFRGM